VVEDTQKYFEVNFDGIPGPTHLFAGLSKGNIASQINSGKISSPKKAALQSLEKINTIYRLGIKQAIVPPHRKPNITPLSVYGFQGSLQEQLKQAHDTDPKLFAGLYSSSNMWTANAATVSPSPDTQSGKLQLTIANLKSNFHRSLESFKTYDIFRKIFSSVLISVHSPLPGLSPDEGAANHLRFCEDYGQEGLEVFVFSFGVKEELPRTKLFDPRQSREASLEVIRKHEIKHSLTIFQNPEAIDAGVFHNDVISTGNKNFFFYHEKSFFKNSETIQNISNEYKKITNKDLILLEVKEKELSLNNAVSSYLFNSQILSPEGKEGMILFAPKECERFEKVRKYINKIILDPANPLTEVIYFDLNESMQNGGGPACLRLRIVMNEAQLKDINQSLMFNDALYKKLKQLIEENYPDELKLEDLTKPEIVEKISICFDKYEEIFNINT
jgi:succinylarginine dihydrolase